LRRCKSSPGVQPGCGSRLACGLSGHNAPYCRGANRPASGTTGLPKPIVHGHGGILLESLKGAVLHNDLRPEDRFHWYSSTGWIMWNCQVMALLGGTTICLFDGSPGGPRPEFGGPDWSTLWRFAALARVSWFGAGAAFYAS
jgi:acetoacetyl-CoA synthetase